ncbi:MAG: 1-(5-phosphoribosyl)-5-((5-phosphoribosylamino)methylideneamino)imidazole-4-carboxamide isomerase [Candidatus Bipolaricaulota bacterium]|nr:1-(5-phosphoribosyl)-5-((5-phosphoribosylamino)methylideneamino)imidazole-4-carboxamide isomerase [Candidatus Bipolaricaulota bacterium]MBS3791393.1 1-(5-phosphoribosyl)-5-((5-phosphoribosylamino)methylideneamino)imidazole-4-carboxamide isomerase [Candidatus Bipolaricaulota bacterium]
MKIYPAIDVMDGEAVRLEEGKRETKKVYGDPVKIAKEFESYVDKVHVVDLDGAFSGSPKNLVTVKKILSRTDLSVQLGGGIRTERNLRNVRELGVTNPIVGTMALEEGFLARVGKEFNGLTVSLDVRSESLAVEGWERTLEADYREVFDKLKYHTNRFIFTSVGSDGKLEGVAEVERFWSDQEVIYAGGVTSQEDLGFLEDRGFDGAIIGRALYEGNLDLAEISDTFGDGNAG